MTVRVVTDSTSDLPAEVVRELGITVVPLIVRFGTEEYRDGVDLSTDDFYHKLVHDPNFPMTSTPPPAAFAEVYEELAQKTDEIISVHLSSGYSAAYETALLGRDLAKEGCRIEVIDSREAIMGEGLIVIATARAAQAGANLDQVIDVVHQAIPRVHMRMAFDTLEYLRRGGRIGRAQELMGSLLKVNPILGTRDGVVYPYARVRGRAKAIEYLINFASSFAHIEGLAIEHATTPDEADRLAQRLDPLFPKERIHMSKVSPVVGAHVGPHVLAVSVLEGGA